ncbi:MAG TPA: hypothetical protein DCL44_09795 [Elusimicrobia bacterium]|nr:hypothetical protein [Elusimicrobiota bacterium]
MSEMGKKTNGDKPATQADLTVLKTDIVALMKSDMSKHREATQAMLESGLTALKTELKADISRVAVGLVKTQAELREVKENMATKADIRTVIGHIDGLTKGLASYEYRLAVRKHQLNDHERRITALEDRP